MLTRIRTLDFLPEIFKTETNSQFLNATLDQLVAQPNTVKVQGYIGSKFGYGINARDKYVVEPSKVRTDYQLDPAVVFLKNDTGTANDFITYPGIIDALNLEGGITNNHDRLFNSQFYSWDSFTDLDKLINFNEYYWIPNGPPAVQISTELVYNAADYTVVYTGNGYQFLADGIPVGGINPSLTLLRGGTYRFLVNQTTQFWIQGQPGVTGFDPQKPNVQTRDVLGVLDNGSSIGVVEFTVPNKNAQDQWNYPGNNTVDLVTTLNFDQVNGARVSTLGNIDGVTALQGRTLMFYQQDGQVGYISSYFGETPYDTNSNTLVAPQTLTVGSTNSIGNVISLSIGTTASLAVNNSVTFDNPTIGGLVGGTIYYITSIINSTDFTVSTTIGGAATTVSTGSGSMIMNINQGLWEEGFYTNVNQNFYTITYVGDPSDPVIRLIPYSAIPNDQRITAVYGTQYIDINFVRTNTGTILKYPYLSAVLDKLYYQDGTNPNNVGQITLIEDNDTNTLNILTEIIGKTNYTAPNGVVFTNGLKVFFTGDIFPASYQNINFYVQGVGTAIELVPETELVTPELFSGAVYTPYDTTPWDVGNYDSTLYIPEIPDYITIARNSLDRNAWSRSNRWFHKDVINATAIYNNDPLIATTFVTQQNKAKRPIIEFYPNLKLFNSGIIGKPQVDFINYTITDAFTQVQGAEVFYPDNQVSSTYTATIPTVVSATSCVITVNANQVTGAFVVGQYINDSANVLPQNAQITAISGTTTLSITVSWSASQSFSGVSNVALFANDFPNSGFQLFEGAKIIFANDESLDVKNKIYVARYTSITGTSTPVITLTEAENGLVLPDEQTTVLGGYNYIGKTFWFDGLEWLQAQQKTNVNQSPLFDIVDENGISFSDSTIYQSTSFTGNKLFAYGIGSGVADAVLGFPIRYSGVSNLGDISFDVSLNSATFDYVEGQTPITQKVNTGYVVNFTSLTETNKQLGWQTAVAESRQYQVFNFNYIAPTPTESQLFPKPFDIIYSSYPNITEFVCDIAASPISQTVWPNIQVYVNNVLIDDNDYTVTITDNQTIIGYNPPDPLIDTPIEILVLSDQVSQHAYYQIPINLSNNPFNQDVTTVNVGDIRGHYQSIFYNCPNSSGVVFGSNNYRDLGNVVPYGNKIIQNSASLVLPGVFLRKQNQNLFNSLMFNSKEYINYKQLLIDTISRIDFQRLTPAAIMLDEALDQIASSKNEDASFFWSDMLPSKAALRTNTYTFANSLDTSIYPLDKIYNYSEANYNGVLVYLTRTDDNGTYTVQLIRNQDYTVSETAPSLTVTLDLQPNDIITINEYNQTYGSYCPNTPTKLGLYQSYIPTVVYDTSYLTPTYFILGHDGSYNKLYGEVENGQLVDYRDQVLLEFEKRIYNNIKVSNQIPVPYTEVLPGFSRNTDYSYDEILQIYSEGFLNWVGQNRIDYKVNYYLSNNQFTWNYNESNNKVNKEVLMQGYWRGIYRYFYDTDTPDTTPWAMIGYSNKPDWWETRYGPAPYTSDNLVLWGDLAAGENWGDIDPITNRGTVLPQYVRPSLLQTLPVDSEGNLVSPFISVVGNYDSLSYNRPWRVGDGAPAEASYLKSSSWPFDLMRILALTKPAEFFNLCVDVDKYRYNNTFGQYLVGDRSHLIVDNIQIYGNGVAKNSYINWIVDYEKQFGIDATTNITQLLYNLDVRLAYRLAGFSDKKTLKFYVEKASANSNNSSLLIPDESYAILLYDNPPLDRITYSSVIVQIVQNGFRVYGNNQTKAYFKTATPKLNENQKTIQVLDSKVKVATNYSTQVQYVPYGTLFPNIQTLSQFLLNYGSYLEQQGMTFEITEEGTQLNWDNMVQQFLYWYQSGWEIGSTLNLNPSAKNLTIDKPNSIVQPLTIQNQNFILNQDLYPIQSPNINVVRNQTVFNVAALNQGDTIAYGQFNMSALEHGIIFNNVTVFNDTIYNLITGLRQNRIAVRGIKSAEWNGTVDAQGFILNQDNITEWQPSIKYTKGAIVKYKSRYYSALKIVPAKLEFDITDWILTEYDEIQKGLLPNPSTQSYEMTLYYNTDEANLEQDADLLSYSLIGFRPRDYLALANLTDTTQVNVYKNFIKGKGTDGTLRAFSGVNLPQGTIKYDLYENWAIKTSEYGGVLNNNFVDLKLNQNLLTGNPSIFGITDGIYTEGVQQEIPLYSIFNYGRYINNPNILATIPDDLTITKLPNAGYVNFDDVKVYAYNYLGLPSATRGAISTPITDLYLGNYVWLANYRGTWQAYTPVPIDQVVTVSNNFDGSANVVFCCEHNLQKYDLIGIVNFNSLVDSYYSVASVVDPYTVRILLTLAPTTMTISGQGVGYKLQSQRITQPSDIVNLPLLNTEFVKNKAWVDTAQNGEWAVYRKSINYQYGAELTQNGSDTYGSSVAYGNNLGFLVSDSGLGQIYRYELNPLSQTYNLTQTITQGVGFGTDITFKNNTVVISDGNTNVYVYTLVVNQLVNQLLLAQTIAAPGSVTSTWGSKLALSGDAKWLYINDTTDNDVYVYKRSNITNKYEYVTQVSEGFVTTEDYGFSLATDYNGDNLFVGAPGKEYDGSTDNWGYAYAYDRTVQNFESQYNSFPEVPQTFGLVWTPSTVTTTATATNSTNDRFTVSSSASLNVFSPVVFSGSVFGGVNTITVYYVYSKPTGTTITVSDTKIHQEVLVTQNTGDYIVVESTDNLVVNSPISFYGNVGSSNIVEGTVYFIKSLTTTTIDGETVPAITISTTSGGATFNIADSDVNLTLVTLGSELQLTTAAGSMTVTQQSELDVYVNGTQLNEGQYFVIGSTISIIPDLLAGDIIAVGGSNFILAQILTSGNTPKIGVHFAYSSDTNLNATEVLFGAPFEINSDGDEGAVIRYSNGGKKYGQIIGTSPTNVVTPVTILLNGYKVVIPAGYASTATETINNAGITNVQAIDNNGFLTISVVNNNLTVPNDKLTITVTNSTDLFQLGILEYTKTQQIENPHIEGSSQFGYNLKFGSGDSFIVSAPTGNRYVATTFDFTDDENLDNDTIFDNNFTRWVDTFPNAGAVYMFDYLPAYNESLSNVSNFVYAQSVDDLNDTYGAEPYYGKALAFNDYTVGIGTPNFSPTNGNFVYYRNTQGTTDWSVFRSPLPAVDIDGIRNAQLYSAITNKTLVNLDYIDPLQGKLLGVVRENIDYISNRDPAGYNNGASKTNIAWGPAQVGSIWFNTSNVKFVDYHQNDIVYNSKYWGTVFPGSEVVVCSWIVSNVTPDLYEGPGIPFNTINYSVEYVVNSSGTLTPLYYYWVRNTGIVFEKTGKTLSDTILEQYIISPLGSGISYFTPLQSNAFALYNCGSDINSNDTVFHLGFSTSDNNNETHNLYSLIRTNYADDFLPGFPTPQIGITEPISLYDRMLDSLAGVDESGQVVPDPYLPKPVQSGILARPRQSFFYNRFLALKNYLTYANQILAEFPIAEYRTSTFLNTYGDDYDTRLYWSYINWWAPGYNNNTKSALQVDFYYQLETIPATEGLIVTVKTNSAGKKETYIYENGLWVRIGLENGTIEFSSKLWDYSEGKFGFGDNFFDTTPFDEYPSKETRFIIRALNEQIYINELLIFRNKSLILLFEYISSETIESQNYLPWLDKTSLVDVSHTLRELIPYRVFQTDNQPFLQGYINEVKPYHVVIKEFLFKYTGTEVYPGDITDFDLPASYSNSTEQFITPELVYDSPSGVNQFLPTSPVWELPEYKQWFNNYGLKLETIYAYPVCKLTSYISTNSRSFSVDNAWGLPINGNILIGEEIIAYSTIDRERGILDGISRGIRGTAIVAHNPGITLLMDLPPVTVLNGSRGYSGVPKVTAYINTSVYPEPRTVAQLQANMSLDSVLSITCLDPGEGYVVAPEIIIEPSIIVTFDSSNVNISNNTVNLPNLLLQTGDLIKYVVGENSTKIEGLFNNQWYYIKVIDALTNTIAFYYNYSDSFLDRDRVDLYTTGTGSNQTLQLGAKAEAFVCSQPTRENILTLRYDRTSYNSRVTDWTPGTFYGSFYTGLYNNSQRIASSSILLDSEIPPINSILASAQGAPFEILNVTDVTEITWDTRTRTVLQTIGIVLGYDSEPYDLTLYDSSVIGGIVLSNYSTETDGGGTLGFYVGMPVKFTGLGFGGILVDTTYYVYEVVDEITFTIADEFGVPVYLTNYTPSPGETPLTCVPGNLTNTTVVEIDYPYIQEVTATTGTTNVITTPKTTNTNGTTLFYLGNPITFTGAVFGDVIENQIYYVTTIIDDEHFTMSTKTDPITTTVLETYSANNRILVNSTIGFSTNDPVIFNQMTVANVDTTSFGNITSGTTYYVANVVSPTLMTVSTVINGGELTLTNQAAGTGTQATVTNQKDTAELSTATGSMTLTIGDPISPGQINGQQFSFYPTSSAFPDLIGTVGNLISRQVLNVQNTSNGYVSINSSDDGTTNFYQGLPLTFDDNIGNLVAGTVYYVDTIGTISTTASSTSSATNRFTCGSTDGFYLDMPVTFTGTPLGGTENLITYYVKSIPNSTQFTVSTTKGGSTLVLTTDTGSVTVNGQPYVTLMDNLSTPVDPGNSTYVVSNITIASPGVITVSAEAPANNHTVKFIANGATLPPQITEGATYYVVNRTSTTFEVSGTEGGSPINTTGSFSGSPFVIDTTDINIVQDAAITIDNLGTATFDVSYILGGYRVLVQNGGSGYMVDNTITITGASLDGTTPENNLVMTIQNVDNNGTLINTPISAVIVSGTPNEVVDRYYAKVVSANSVQLYYDSLLQVPVPSSEFNYVGQVTTSVSATTTGTNRITVADSTLFQANDIVVFRGETFGNIQPNISYYVLSTPTPTTITISTEPNGSVFALTSATGSCALTMSGDYAFLPEPFYFDQSIVKYNGKLYECIISNNDDYFVIGKWLLLRSDDRKLNALDRIIGYYDPTSNMPGIDLTQLVAGVTYPNGTYLGNPFAPEDEYILDTILTDLPFYPTEIDCIRAIWNGSQYYVASNTPEYSAILISADIQSWAIDKISNKNLLVTDLIQSPEYYVMTSTNAATPILISPDGLNWVSTGAYTPYGNEPYDSNNYDVTSLIVESNSLNAVTYYNNRYVAVGENIVSAVDGIVWAEVYRNPTTLSNTLNDVVRASTNFYQGYIAVGGQQEVVSGSGTAIPIIENRAVVVLSDDGVNWTKLGLYIIDSYFNAVGYNNNFIVAVGNNSYIYTSTNGSNWVQRYGSGLNNVSLRDIVWANELFVVVGDKDPITQQGTILTSIDGVGWLPQFSNISNNLNSVSYDNTNNIFVAVGENNTIITSTNGTVWTGEPVFLTTPSVYDVQGGSFTDGYAPEELVAGVVTDNLSMIVKTRAGTNWLAEPLLSTPGYEHVGYETVSNIIEPTVGQTEFSFDNVIQNPLQIIVYDVDMSVPYGLGTQLYEGIDYTITSWMTKTITLNTSLAPNHSLRIDVYAVGNGDQIVQTNSLHTPLRFNTLLGTSEMYLNCNYTGTKSDGSGVFQPNSTSVWSSPIVYYNGNPLIYGITTDVTATESITNYLTCVSTSGMNVNDPIMFTDTTFGNIDHGTTYYIAAVVDGTRFTISTTLAGPVMTQVDAIGGMNCITNDFAFAPIPDSIQARILFANTYNDAASVIGTSTSASNNAITVSSTASFAAGQQVIFTGTTFGGIASGRIYYVLNILNGTEFTISQSIGGPEYSLTNASGEMTVTVDGPDHDYINVVVFGETQPLQYSATFPIAETFTGDGATTVFALTNALSVDNATNAIVEINGLRVDTIDYSISLVTNDITFTVAPALNDNIVVTTFGDTERQQFVTDRFTGLSVGNIINISNSSPPLLTFGTPHGLPNSVPSTSNPSIRIDGIDGAIQLNNNVYYYQYVNGTSIYLYNSPYDSTPGAVNDPVDGSTLSTYLGNGWAWVDAQFTLTNTLQQSNTDRLWVTVNGQRINSDGLFVNPNNNLTILSTVTSTDIVLVTSMIPTSTPNEVTYINQVDKNSIPTVYRANNNCVTWLSQELYDTDDEIHLYDVSKVVDVAIQNNTVSATNTVGVVGDRRYITSVVVYNNTTSSTVASSNYELTIVSLAPVLVFSGGVSPGDSVTLTVTFGNTISINGEKIRFSNVDYVGNTVSGLQRGIDGTGVQTYHPLYATVYSYIPTNLLDESYYNLTWNSNNYNVVEGDPLQISTTNAALFLNSPNT